jgi:UDP-N-acetylmuramyl pentapeptide phosphotransferase/UDP-N-acetylglucosamine-1-phosphate transferase
MSELLLTAAVIMIFVAVISLLEYRLKTKGPLFSGAATPRMRLLALLLGIVFTVLFVNELTSSDVIHLVFPILAVALIGYSLGAGALLRRVQGEQSTETTGRATSPSQQAFGESVGETLEEKEPIFPLKRIGRLLIILGVGLVLAAVVIYAAGQAAAHPDSPISLVLIIGIIILVVVARLRNWFGLFTRSKTSQAFLDHGVTKTEATSVEEWECEVCGAIVDANATVCPACGTKFES